ncbi:ferredoxin--NADP reductase [Rhizobium halophytocola]|uniref:ferredoxin--NADP(+) reductase n=1 Tax=Rhizobium halophytocola TaxID=735519 RepID=A0ABS4DU23_9HYPH|nr:ferredoxin--NADP reductase [Rhizobium halophytocola]MBP1849186.1 ferredoxin--NADP+ reductase [Rhizobium halophytocola]
MTSATNAVETVQSSFPIPENVFAETVVEVQHYTDRLFRFRITRPPSFRFRSGEFVMIGLPNAEKPVYRAYSIASPSWDEEVEFFSIKVENGPLTEHLQKIQPGDTVLMRKKPTGTLVLDALVPGKRLYMLSTGTGVAPFASLVRDPETFEKFEEVILVQTCRDVGELTYATELVDNLLDDPLIGEMAAGRLRLHATTTREHSERMGRATDLMKSGKLFEDLGVPKIDPAVDRAMICGSMDMLKDTKAILENFGLVEGANNAPATFVVERAFVG